MQYPCSARVPSSSCSGVRVSGSNNPTRVYITNYCYSSRLYSTHDAMFLTDCSFRYAHQYAKMEQGTPECLYRLRAIRCVLVSSFYMLCMPSNVGLALIHVTEIMQNTRSGRYLFRHDGSLLSVILFCTLFGSKSFRHYHWRCFSLLLCYNSG